MKAAHEVSDGLTSDAARIFDPPSQGFRTMRVYVLATCLLFKLLCVTVIHRNMWAFFSNSSLWYRQNALVEPEFSQKNPKVKWKSILPLVEEIVCDTEVLLYCIVQRTDP